VLPRARSRAALQAWANAVKRSVGLCSRAIIGHSRDKTANLVGTCREGVQHHSHTMQMRGRLCHLTVNITSNKQQSPSPERVCSEYQHSTGNKERKTHMYNRSKVSN
jgi:hypothetical protein